MTREEAIKEAYGIPVNKKQHEALQILIPELKENGDERIRIALCDIVRDMPYMETELRAHGLTVEKTIAYLENQKDASYAIEAVDRIDKYIDEHLANAHDMKNSNPDKKYYRGWDDALGKMAGILQDVYSNEKQKEQMKETVQKGLDVTDFCEPIHPDIANVLPDVINELTWGDEAKQKEQKPIKMEVYEIGKGTTICGQYYKCKKDYMTGTCRYIKDVIYHCSRDGYLNDQNGVSWSCTPEWFNEYIQSNAEWAEEEKTRFVSGQFLQCKRSFDEFKEGEHYWLEYIGDDMYVGRSDNILNQKFHITPRQLYTLFSQQLEENEKEQDKCPEYCVRSHCIGCSIYEKQKEDKPSIFPPGLGEVRWNPISSVQQKPIFRVGDTIMAKDGTGIPQEMFYIERIEDGFYWEKDNTILISNQDEFQLVEPADKVYNVSKDEYVKKFKALCDGYEIKLPNREHDIYHLCDDLAELFGNTNNQELNDLK